VEDNGAESACRGTTNTACTRCTEAINTRYRVEIGVAVVVRVVVFVIVESDSCVKKEDCAAAELI
jgi:hypothetical protein